jgi:hypothetical protein
MTKKVVGVFVRFSCAASAGPAWAMMALRAGLWGCSFITWGCGRRCRRGSKRGRGGAVLSGNLALLVVLQSLSGVVVVLLPFEKQAGQ